MKCDKLAYFGMEPQLDRPVETLGIGIIVMSLFEHSYTSRFEKSYYTDVCATLGQFGTQVLQEQVIMEGVQEDSILSAISGW